MVAAGLDWQSGDRLVTTIVEHHSNLLPWPQLRQKGVETIVICPGQDGIFDIEVFDEAITPNTRLVTVSHVSNILGTVQPVREIAAICKERGAYFLVDGAQSVPHFSMDAQYIGCDFLCFSGHKMLGPTGTGVLWMRDTVDAVISPLIIGGGTVDDVTTDGYTLTTGYRHYEGGKSNISG